MKKNELYKISMTESATIGHIVKMVKKFRKQMKKLVKS